VDTVFAPELAGLDREEIRRWYNGYNWLGESVYNPFDLLLLFDKRQFRPWWFERPAPPTFLIDLLTRRGQFAPARGTSGGGRNDTVALRRQRHADRGVGYSRPAISPSTISNGPATSIFFHRALPQPRSADGVDRALLFALVPTILAPPPNLYRLHRLLSCQRFNGPERPDFMPSMLASRTTGTTTTRSRTMRFYASVFLQLLRRLA